MSPIIAIDPLPDQHLRCRHDMLHRQCSWCKGLPDVPIDGGEVDHGHRAPRLAMRYPAERRGNCARCGEDVKLGEWVAWSAADGGVIGECCTDGAS